MERVTQVARALAEPSRAAMLDALMDGEGKTIGALARVARVSAATASSHLRVLVAARLVTTTARGRERVVAIADANVAEILERLATLAAPSAKRELRFARTCYDHLAGELAILVVDGLVERRWLHRTTDNLEPAPALLEWLASHGHPVASSKRPLSRACLDWTERVPHVAGRVGAALASTVLDEDWVRRVPGGRTLRLTTRGRDALATELGIATR
ncbi:MAG TPA: helix-turn-helix domain-containing protein [Kofleriaceae bacterium]|jgi:DNA-binding transcriptional ArsR family regulator